MVNTLAQALPRAARGQLLPEPSRSMLKRVAVEVGEGYETAIANGDNKLAIEAESILGYRPLRQALHLPGALKRALAKLEIEVFDEDSVDEYKAKMVTYYDATGKMAMPTWRLTRLEGYSQQVPKFALSKAIEIKRELPEARFYIDQLAFDPFLIVSVTELPDYHVNTQSRALGGEMAAYVEVWSEPKFEAEMWK